MFVCKNCFEEVRTLPGFVSQNASILKLPKGKTILITGQRFAAQKHFMALS